MGKEQRQPWELAAEELVRHVRGLLDGHGSSIEKALRKSLGKEEARSQLRQIERLVEVLEIELWRKGTAPDKSMGGFVASGLKIALTALVSSSVTLVTTAAYEDLTGAEEKAEQVIDCVIREEAVAGVMGWGGVLADEVTDAGGRWGTGKSNATGDAVASALGAMKERDGGDQDDAGPPTPSSPPLSEAARVLREGRVEVQVGPTRKVDSVGDYSSSMTFIDDDEVHPSVMRRLLGRAHTTGTLRWNNEHRPRPGAILAAKEGVAGPTAPDNRQQSLTTIRAGRAARAATRPRGRDRRQGPGGPRRRRVLVADRPRDGPVLEQRLERAPVDLDRGIHEVPGGQKLADRGAQRQDPPLLRRPEVDHSTHPCRS